MLTDEVDELMCALGLSDDRAWSALRLNCIGMRPNSFGGRMSLVLACRFRKTGFHLSVTCTRRVGFILSHHRALDIFPDHALVSGSLRAPQTHIECTGTAVTDVRIFVSDHQRAELGQ